MKRNTLMKVLTIAMLLTCGLFARGGEISDYFFKQAKENPQATSARIAALEKSRNREDVASTNHGTTEIGIERSVCFGTCPIYTFIVKSDGTFRYKGEKYVERIGEFSGRIPSWKFNQLAQFIRDSGYMKLEDEYNRSVTDNPTTYTMVVMNGKRKAISNYADAGPSTLWAIEQLIDDLMTKAEWNGPQKPDQKK